MRRRPFTINIADLRTFRLTCRHCHIGMEVSLEHWTPAKMGDVPECPSCHNSWGDDGQTFKALADALKALQVREARLRPPTTPDLAASGPSVTIQVEITEIPTRP